MHWPSLLFGFAFGQIVAFVALAFLSVARDEADMKAPPASATDRGPRGKAGRVVVGAPRRRHGLKIVAHGGMQQ